MEPEERAALLRIAVERYRREASPFYDEALEEVTERVDRNGSISKADIGALVAWKRLNASTRWANALMQTPDSKVRAATTAARDAALESSSDIQTAASRARSALSSIPGFGVGDALASAVIYVLAPARMAVYDRRAQLGLERLGLELSAKSGRYGRYMAIVDKLITETSEPDGGLRARDVDLGLFTLGGTTPQGREPFENTRI